jgi:hypothetical protein
MHESDFWTNCAEAMELSIEGNGLIAREIADLARELWHRMRHSLGDLLQGVAQHRHLPPV